MATQGSCGFLGSAEGLALGHPLPSGLSPLLSGQDALCAPVSPQDRGAGLPLLLLHVSAFHWLSA